jgi:MFS superfamily sulfate permease-like transporter
MSRRRLTQQQQQQQSFADPDFDEDREETWCACFVNIFNPLAYARSAMRCSSQSKRVCYSFMGITPSDMVSGFILGLLMMSFARVFSSTIFDEVSLDAYIGLGSGTQAVAIIVGGLGHVFYSHLGIAIAAPDLNPAVFFGIMASTIKASVMLKYNARGGNLDLVTANAQIVSTVLAVMIISTVTLGVILYFVGRLKLTKVVQMLPDSVLTGGWMVAGGGI